MTVGQHKKLERIVDLVAAAGRVNRNDIVYSRTRGSHSASVARKVCMWAGRKLGIQSVTLGYYFQRDHATVLYAEKTIEEQLKLGAECPLDIHELVEVARKELEIAGGVKTETEAEVGATGIVQAA